MYISRREVNVAAALLKNSKNTFFSRNLRILFAKKQKTKKLYPKEWSKKHIFHSYLFIFLRKPKRMLKFLQDGLWNGMVQEIMDKKGSLQLKTHFSVSDHVTLCVVRRRHKLNHTCPQWMLSRFGPMKAYMCWVTANSFLPSNGLKRYCNGPLTPLTGWCYQLESWKC